MTIENVEMELVLRYTGSASVRGASWKKCIFFRVTKSSEPFLVDMGLRWFTSKKITGMESGDVMQVTATIKYEKQDGLPRKDLTGELSDVVVISKRGIPVK